MDRLRDSRASVVYAVRGKSVTQKSAEPTRCGDGAITSVATPTPYLKSDAYDEMMGCSWHMSIRRNPQPLAITNLRSRQQNWFCLGDHERVFVVRGGPSIRGTHRPAILGENRAP